MKYSKHKLVKNWRREMEDTFSAMYPGVHPDEIRKFLNEEIQNNLVNPECKIHNNYIHKSVPMTLLDVVDWIDRTKPICGGHGVFYKNQHEISNALAQMILKFLSARKAFKDRLQYIADKTSYEYKTYDRKQLSEKIMSNSIYGALGNLVSFLYNEYTAPSVTGTGKSLISTTCLAFEAFMTDSVAFNNTNECITYLNNICSEKYIIDDTFLRDVTVEEVQTRMINKMYEYDETMDNIIHDYLVTLPQNILNRVYYKNNIYDFSKLPEISAMLTDIVRKTEDFKNPNKLPESSRQELEELWDYYNQFVVYNNFTINRIQRLKNDRRKTVVTIDTDSNILNCNPWVEFMNDYIISTDDALANREKNNIRFISINIICYMLTSMIKEVLKKYVMGANIPKEFHKYINMKNEYLFSILILAFKKKKYISSIRLREGDEIFPEKLDVKGFEFMKSSATEDIKKRFEGIVKKRLIQAENISIPDILRDMNGLKNDITTSLSSGEKTYLTPKSVKEEGAYKPGMALRGQGFRGIIIWNKLYPDMEITLPSKVDIVKVTLDTDASLNKLKLSNPDIYEKIEKGILNNMNPKIQEKKVPVIAIPRSVDKIPEWIVPFIDYDTITVDVLKKFYPVLKSLGVESVRTSKKEYLSNIISM